MFDISAVRSKPFYTLSLLHLGVYEKVIIFRQCSGLLLAVLVVDCIIHFGGFLYGSLYGIVLGTRGAWPLQSAQHSGALAHLSRPGQADLK